MTPGAQILVARNGEVIYNKSFGNKTYDSSDEIKWNDIYDLASLTKILSTVPLMMKEYENENITLETTLSQMFPNKNLNDKLSLTIKEMFSHQSGLYPWIPFYKKTIDSVTNKPLSSWYKLNKSEDFNIEVNENLFLKDSFLDSIRSEILKSEYNNEKSYVYSDLPYYFMKEFLEQKNFGDLDFQLKKKILFDLGANNTTFNPTKLFNTNRIAPSEIDDYFRNSILQGYVHDMGAAMQGGIGGHAGLFSNSNDVAKIMQMFLQGGYYGGKRFFKNSTIKYFNTCYFCDSNNRRGIGFDKPQLDDSKSTCGCVPMTSFGHSGFTGTYAWADPENNIVYVFLSNRTFPTMNNNLLSKHNIRTEIQKIIYESFN
jgi:CubicO group peptidase (beta-lactamase class C family)